ncbi:hypothetical protein A3K63_04770 [Candidatus Micrarchaeota archaeon RBG_16_49_10]|nr:MAG: hypothetical protein A3K63_04770 [Candidatus Micrarchaeota archaeon RBG_16_49_10]
MGGLMGLNVVSGGTPSLQTYEISYKLVNPLGEQNLINIATVGLNPHIDGDILTLGFYGTLEEAIRKFDGTRQVLFRNGYLYSDGERLDSKQIRVKN